MTRENIDLVTLNWALEFPPLRNLEKISNWIIIMKRKVVTYMKRHFGSFFDAMNPRLRPV